MGGVVVRSRPRRSGRQSKFARMEYLKKRIEALEAEKNRFVTMNAPVALQAEDILRQYKTQMAGYEASISELRNALVALEPAEEPQK